MSEYVLDYRETYFRSVSGAFCADTKAIKEEIVRCKDCKHYIAPGTIHFDDGTTNLGACSIVRAYMVKITPDGFCAWGERKTEDD